MPSQIVQDRGELVECLASIVAVSLDGLDLSPRCGQAQNREEIATACGKLQLRNGRRIEVSLEQNANDALDLRISASDAGYEAGKSHDPIDSA